MLKSLGLRAQLVLVVALALAPVGVLAALGALNLPAALVLALLMGVVGALWTGMRLIVHPARSLLRMVQQVEAGDLASPGRPLVTLHAPGGLRAVVEVPSSRTNSTPRDRYAS